MIKDIKAEILSLEIPIKKTYLNKFSNENLLYHSNIFIFESPNINFNDRIKYFSKLYNLSKQVKCDFSMAHNLTLSSKVYQELGDYKRSINNCLKANLIWESLIDTNDLAISGYVFSYTNLSNIYSSMGLYDVSIKYLTAGQKLISKSKKPYIPSIRINMNLGIVYHNIKKYSKSIASYDKILEASEARNDIQIIIPALINKSSVYLSKKKYRKAISLNQKAEKYLNENSDVVYTPVVYQNLGESFYCLGDYNKAKNYFTKSYEILKSQSLVSRIQGMKNNIAKTEYKLGNIENSIKIYKEVLESKESDNDFKHKIKSCDMLGRIYDQSHDYKQSLKYHKKHINYIDKYSIKKHDDFKIKSDKAIESLEIQIDFLSKEKENSELKIELNNKKRELVTKKITALSENIFLFDIITKLKKNSYENDSMIRKKIAETMTACQGRIDHSANWKQFFKLFNDLNPEFVKQFKHFDLTEQELRVCMMIKLGLTAIEIANILSVSLRGIQQHRYRIKKKISVEENLTSYIRKL